MKKKIWGVVILLGLGFAAGVFMTSPFRRPAAKREPGPPILQKVQAIGELRTARYTYQNVFQHETALEPAEWARYLPGAASMVESATRNTAQMEVHATVDAGVDLGKAAVERFPGRTVLVLPKARVYEPQVRGHVFSAKSGTFWRDDNIALNAVEEAKIRLKFAAIQQGIRKKAEEEAVNRVRALLAELGAAKVEIAFR